MKNVLYKKIGNLNSALNLLVTVLITVSAIFANYFGAIYAEKFVIPLYLDSILTIAVVAITGLIPGLACAFLSCLLLIILRSAPALFTICHIMTALLAAFVFHYYDSKSKGEYYSLSCFLWAGFWAALSNGIIGNIISYFVFRGRTGRPSANVLVQGIYSATQNLSFAIHFGGLLQNVADKILSAVLSYLIYKLIAVVCFRKPELN